MEFRKPSPFRRMLLGMAVAAAASAAVPGVSMAADGWPTRPIRLVVPFPPGGSGDSLARIVGQALSKQLGQQIIVENRPGANLFLGASEVARAEPDGYTLLLALDTIFTVNPYVFSKIPYDPVKDFTPVSLVTTQTMWFVTRPKSTIASMHELVDLARSQPNRYNYGSGALIGQLTGELLKSLTNASMTYIPFKGSAPAAQSLLAGELDVAVSDITPLLQYIQDGRLVALGQTGLTRSDILPQVPTMVELGIKGFDVTNWFAVYAPAGTPAPVVSRLGAAIASAVAMPDVKARIASFGLEATSSTPQELAQRAKSDAAKWERVIRAANIRLD